MINSFGREQLNVLCKNINLRAYHWSNITRRRTFQCKTTTNRFFSHSIMTSSKVTTVPVTQGGLVHIQMTNTKTSMIKITSAWQDHCDITENPTISITHDSDTNSCMIKSLYIEDSHDNSNILEIIVPEIVSIYIYCQDIDLTIKKKIMGDVTVKAFSGQVSVDKIRGENIDFNIGKGDIKVNNTIEGSRCSIQCRSLIAKLMYCNDTRINTSDLISIEALYVKHASLTSIGSIMIDLLRGYADLLSNEGDIFLRGVDGAFTASSKRGRIEVQVNKFMDASSSAAEAAQGNVLAKIDPKVVADVECRTSTTTSSGTRSSITITSNSFAEDKNINDNESISSVVRGRLLGEAQAIRGATERQSGKINIDAANSQSLGSSSSTSIPQLLLSSNAHIRLESLSWMDAIRQKHGFHVDAEDNSKVAHRLGRTGQAKKDAMELLKEAYK